MGKCDISSWLLEKRYGEPRYYLDVVIKIVEEPNILKESERKTLNFIKFCRWLKIMKNSVKIV